jgi:hypothetical protein
MEPRGIVGMYGTLFLFWDAGATNRDQPGLPHRAGLGSHCREELLAVGCSAPTLRPSHR